MMPLPARMKRFLPLLALALAACSPEGEDEPAAPPSAPAPTATAARPAPPLTALTAEDVEGAALTGELACAFTETGQDDPLLVAMADVLDEAVAEGVLKLGPTPLRLKAAEPGGFNAMVYGASFVSGDLAARVEVTSRDAIGGGEAPPLPATLEIGSQAGTQRVEGSWACGP